MRKARGKVSKGAAKAAAKGQAKAIEQKTKKKLPPVDGYVIANTYTLGEAFKIRNARLAAASSARNGGAEAAGAAADEEEEEEEELNEYEMERQQNILRNQAFLQSLGLA